MPPKAKLHKDKGKLKSLPKPKPQEINNSQNETEPSTSNEDIQRQFEVELCWCIQQLQNALASGKLNPKQVQETSKTLNTLMSNSAPIIKKRQLMRMSFGDYRAKMAEEERKFNKVNHQLKLSTPKPSSKSVFVKKAAILKSDKDFKFNFDIKSDDVVTNDIRQLTLENVQKSENFHFLPSDNNFRFNFSENVE